MALTGSKQPPRTPELDHRRNSESELREAVLLRRAMRDLLALCTIPAAWVGREPDAIAKGVVDVLVTALRVECGYLMLRGDPANIEVMQGVAPREVIEALLLKCAGELPRAPLVHDLCHAHRAAIVPIRVASKSGFVAAISSRVDFPTETESMLMSVAANQAAISLEAAQLRTQAELERRRLQELMAQAPAAMALMYGPEHRYTYVNDYYVRVTGRTSEADFIGKTLEESLPETETAVFRKLLDDVYQTGNPYVGREMKATLNRDGQNVEVYFDFVYQAIRNSAGHIEDVLVHAVDVTDKVLARRTIAESEERLRLAQSAAQIGTWEWDAVSGKNSLSPELHYLFATSAEDPDRVQVWAQRVHPEDWERVQQLMQEGYRHGEMEFEYRYLNPDMGTRWFYCKGRRGEGETRMLGVVQDVTQRKTAEEALRESEEELRILQRVGAALASELELKKLVQAVTDAGRELSQAEFGAFFYNDTDAAGEKYLLYTLSGAPDEAFSGYPMPRNTAVFGPTFRGEGTVRVADIRQDPRYGKNPPYNGMPKGHLPVRSYLAVPVISRSGEVIGGLFYGHSQVGIFTERAERLVEGIARQAAIAIDNARLFETAHQQRDRAEESEARLRANQEKLQSALVASQRLAAIVESSDDAIVSKDLNGIVTSWNLCAERTFGYKAEEIIGKPITTIIPSELQDDERRILATIARGERIEHFETVRRTKSGELIDVSLTISPIKDEQGRVIGAAKIARDITQRKRTEKALQLTEKLASVGRLAATVAHELNNPLEAVTNFIFLAQTTDNLPESAKEYLTSADRELERVSHIAQQTLGFYRDTSARTVVDIRESLDDVLRVFESKLRYKSLKANINAEKGLKMEALGGEVRQVFSNLISNAIDASPTRGMIKIHAKTIIKRGSPYAQIAFADHGCGIPDGVKSNIFNPFFTTKSDVGTGLGLWVSKSLVEKHGGRIAFRSTQGKGTVFILQFPLRGPHHNKGHEGATA
ncbi:MAG TPA: PAS domain S-box protein [Candidatus Angelobacter sp.]|nr:PAS domain S-box protein [Candidatus Angelobacter sp.]